MAGLQKKLLAIDTNILFDLAQENDFAHTFSEVFQERGYFIKVSPTAFQELVHYATVRKCAESSTALKALQQMKGWGIFPFDLSPAEHAIAAAFSSRLIGKGFLPEGEINDEYFLAETSLTGIPVLATRDDHLLGIEPTYLHTQFDEADLMPVAVFHPRKLLAALKFSQG